MVRANENEAPTLCEPGAFLHYDYRSEACKSGTEEEMSRSNSGIRLDARQPIIKAVQWNIERGYKMEQIIAILKRHQADIICLQELDIECERTDYQNVPQMIAEALGMNCVFVTEFVEFHSPLRSFKTQGGGVHGNAILSYYDMDPFVIPHGHHPVNWKKDGKRIREPRRGERVGFGANIHVPGLSSPIRTYSLHLEVFCGIYGRLKQFADIMEDAKKHVEQFPCQLIFADLNTMAHGIARLSPFFCSDKLRFKSIGYSEAEWWQRHIFDQPVCKDHNPLMHHVPHHISKRDAEALTNSHYYDPFSLTKDTTLQKYRGLYRGKLDWTILRGCHVLAKGMDNHDFSASDHKLLYVLVRPCSGSDKNALMQDIRQAYKDGRVLINHTRNFYRSIIRNFLTAFILAYIIHLFRRLMN